MAEPLKTFFSPDLVRRLADDIARVHPDFDAERFRRRATNGLKTLELMDRARHIARALAESLPPHYPDAIAILLRSLGPPHDSDELIGAGMAPFVYLPHTLFVAERGLEHFDLSMRAQYELTRRFSAEGSIRPYIARDPERAFSYLTRWTADPDPHVRRLPSEGTRLRLPWAMRVPWLDAHPERVIELLERLRDDPSTMVRRSVANNLNDLGKVHPDLLVRTCAAWLEDGKGAGSAGSAQRRALVEHALRSAVKRGEPGALRLLGYGDAARVRLDEMTITPRRVAIGGNVSISFTLRSTARGPQSLLVDLAVHFVKATGRTSPKVFKLQRVELAPGERAIFRKRISLAVHTTRKPRAGAHEVDVLVNGARIPAGSFTVTRARQK